MKHKVKKVLALLLTIVMLCGMLVIPASAAAVDSLTIKVVGKDGVASTVKTLTYDGTNQTFLDGDVDAGLVTDFSSQTGGGYFYTGLNRKPDPRCLAVATKGILLENLVTYAQNASGVANLKGDTVITMGASDGAGVSKTYESLCDTARYYYADWYTAETYSAAVDTDTITGVQVPTVLAVTGYHVAKYTDSTTTAADLPALADDAYSLRLLMGQKAGGDATEINLGAESIYNADTVTFAPVYYDITVADGVAVGTEGEDGFAYTVSGASVTTGDDWFKAVAGEQVTLTVETGVGVSADVAVTANGEAVETAQNGNVYTFTMPAGAVSVAVETADIQYTVAVAEDITGGTVTVEPSTQTYNGTVKVTAKANVGYALKEGSLVYTAQGEEPVAITDLVSGAVDQYTFTMPTANVTVSAEFEKTADAYTVTLPESIRNGSITVSKTEGLQPGEAVVLTPVADSAYTLAVSYTYTTASGVENTVEIVPTNGYYVFTMPAADVTISGGFYDIDAAVWDGASVDVSWYNTTDTVFHIKTPAQLMGLAAIVNGKVNSDIIYIYGDDDGTKIVPSYFIDTSGYGGAADGYRGQDNFVNKVIYIDNDLDMGGVYDAETDTWSGARFMAIGGKYRLNPGDTESMLNAPFCGSLDGQGHTISNIYFYESGSYWAAEVGLIGLWGLSDGEYKDLENKPVNAFIRNVIIGDGYIESDRSVGGIVGKVGKNGTVAAEYTNNGNLVIENCANFATVVSHQAKGTGGIAGAAWNGLTVRNCYNAGTIIAGSEYGGVVGSNEAALINCYNVGMVNSGTSNYGVAYPNGGDSYVNCYWLLDTAVNGIGSSTNANVIGKTAEEMQSAEFLAEINGDGRAFVADYEGDAAINNGYPILRVQAGSDTATVTSITTEGEPVTFYVGGQTFNAGSLKIWANYSDGTRETVTDYTVSKTDAFTTADNGTNVTISGTHGGIAYSYTYTVYVAGDTVSDLSITTQPTSTVYAVGETYNPTGIRVKVTYLNGTSTTVTLAAELSEGWAVSPSVVTAEDDGKPVTITYTYGGVEYTVQTSADLTVVDVVEQDASGTYLLYTANDMLWYASANNNANRGAGSLNAKLMADVDLSEVTWTPIGGGTTSTTYFKGTFDGGYHTVTLNHTNASIFQGLFGIIHTGTVQNVTVAGSISGASNTGGIAGYLSSTGSIINCVNKATVTGSSSYVGGIVGRLSAAGTIENCVNEGDVKGTSYVGGITAYAVITSAAITNCGNTGDVTGSGSYVGGIIGYSKAAVSGSYNTGAVSGTYDVGGIAGYNYAGAITDCYNTGDVTASAGTASYGVGGVVGRQATVATKISNVYSTGTVTGSNGTINTGAVIGYLNVNITLSNVYALEDTAASVIGKNNNKTITGEAAFKTADELKAMAETLGEAFTAAADDVNGGYPVLTWQSVPRAEPGWYSAVATELVIDTADELREFAQIVNGTHPTFAQDDFAGKTVILGADIALAADNLYTATISDFGQTMYPVHDAPHYYLNEDAPVWTPIGTGTSTAVNAVSSANYFAGTFDGAGHTISGIYTGDGTLTAGNTVTVQGLFGCVSGTIKNLTVSGCITAKHVAGGVAAYLNGGTIENCVNYAPVFTDGCTTPNATKEDGLKYSGANGGIVGLAAGETHISDCANYGNIVCVNSNFGGRTGGILGLMNASTDSGSITRCVNYGAINAYQYAGGIAGWISSSTHLIDQCANYGHVTAYASGSNAVAGVAALTRSNISNCYNAGTVEIHLGYYDKASGLGGIVASLSGTVTNCYNVGNFVASGSTKNSYYGKTWIGTCGGIAAEGFGSATNNKLINCYVLEGTGYGNVTTAFNYVTVLTAEELKGADFLAAINGDGRAFVADAEGEASINDGYPILRWQVGDTATVISITTEGTPKTTYVSGQSFDLGAMKIWANYSDGTREAVTDYTISKPELTAADNGTKVTISGTYSGIAYSYTYTVYVAEDLVAGLAVTAEPSSTIYHVGETFVPTGIKVTVTYLNGTSTTVTLAAEMPEGWAVSTSVLTAEDNGKPVTITYTYNGKDYTTETASTLEVIPALETETAEDGTVTYLLYNVNDLRWFAAVNNDANRGAGSLNAKLMADVDLSEINWTPIGGSSSTTYFTGAFDGGDHTVTLNITSSNYYQGLFSCVSTGTVKNVTVAGSISGGYYVGGVVAYLTSTGSIINCVNKATLTGTCYVGGIVGDVNTTGTIENCVNQGDVTASIYNAGGIAGRLYGAGTIKNCVNAGTVTGGSNYTGGITSYASNTSAAITNCANTGTITGKNYTGGIIGYSKAAVSGSYNTGAVSGAYDVGGITGYNYAGAITDCYNTGDVTASSGTASYGVGGIVGRQATVVTTISNVYNAGTVTGTNGTINTGAIIGYLNVNITLSNVYAREGSAATVIGKNNNKTITGEAAFLSADAMKSGDLVRLLGSAFNCDLTGEDAINNGYAILDWQGGTEPATDTSWYNTTDTSFVIKTADQLYGFADIVNGTANGIAQDDFAGKTVTLGGDIVLAANGLYTAVPNITYGTTAWSFTTTQYVINDAAPIWTPIGSGTATSNTNASGNAFAGTFDGAGYTISGIYTGTTDAAVGNTDTVQGLFGIVTGTVKNVTVSGCITGKMVVGGVVAHLNGGTVENCVNNAIIFADGGTTPKSGSENGLSRAGAVGGIVGNAMTGSTVTDCVNNGAIICANTNKGGRVGGIIGLIDGSNDVVTIACNANHGSVDAYQYAGGIVGMTYSSVVTIDRCYNTGVITGHSGGHTYVGGIAGSSNGLITNCYNSGRYGVCIDGTGQNTAKSFGGIVGMYQGSSAKTSVSNCYSTGAYFYTGNATAASSYGMVCGSGYGTSAANTLSNSYALSIEGLTGEDVANGCLTVLSAEELKSADFLAALNSTGRAFVADLEEPINSGYPILRWQAGDDTAVISEIVLEGTPVTTYVTGQSFDLNGSLIWANYSDGTRELVTGYTVSKTDAFTADDNGAKVTISGTHAGRAYEFSYYVIVANDTVISITVDMDPTTMSYTEGDAIDLTGAQVTIAYLSGTNTTVTLTSELPDGFAVTPAVAALENNGQAITISYTVGAKTVSANTTATLTVEKSPNIEVTVNNNTGTTPVATVTAPAGGWVEGENTFTVSASLACVVAVQNEDGTYTVLEAAANEDGSYSFTATLAAGATIVVVVKGDVNGDGKVNVVDAAQIQLASNGSKTLSGLNALGGDVSGDGKVNVVDVAQVQLVSNGSKALSW